MPKRADRICTALASGLYLSHLPATLFPSGLGKRKKWTGAGLVGTLWGLALLPWVPADGVRFLAFYAVSLALAVAVSTRAEEVYGQKDDPRIVIDETVGYWAATAFLPRGVAVLAGGFILFRILDAAKTPPFLWLERLPRGWGVVLDDVAAGIAANLLLRVALGAQWI